jgi:hypothetical protein
LCDTGHIRGKVSSLKIRYHHLKLARPNGWDGSIKQICAGPQISETRNACDVIRRPDRTAGFDPSLPLDLVRILATRRTHL